MAENNNRPISHKNKQVASSLDGPIWCSFAQSMEERSYSFIHKPLLF